MSGWEALATLTPITLGLLGSLVAGIATGIGALPLLLVRRPGDATHGILMGFSAGVMLGATSFSLVMPGLDAAGQVVGQGLPAALMIGTGILIGAGGLVLVHHLVPHEHEEAGREGRRGFALSRAWLLVLAIGLHNIPEGLAVGVGFTGDLSTGLQLTVGIALQNMPEGLIVAAALIGDGYSRSWSVFAALVSGLVEPLSALVAAAFLTIVEALLPWGFAFAAGAMLFVISHEMIPEAYRRGLQSYATGGLMVGFVAMLILSESFN